MLTHPPTFSLHNENDSHWLQIEASTGDVVADGEMIVAVNSGESGVQCSCTSFREPSAKDNGLLEGLAVVMTVASGWWVTCRMSSRFMRRLMG